MLFKSIQKRLLFSVNLVALALSISACAMIAPPVQEMSNARQSIKAAKQANAEKFATNVLAEAKQRLRSAMRELDAGEYERARRLALEAKHLALKARQLSETGNNKAD